jgi:hypothetical protein
VRVLASVEEDQLADVRPDHRAVLLYVGYARGVPVVADHEFAAACLMIRAEENSRHRIRVDVTLKSHRGSALDIQDHAVPVIDGRADGLCARCPGQFEEKSSVALVEPGKALPDLAGMQPTARYFRHIRCLTG